MTGGEYIRPANKWVVRHLTTATSNWRQKMKPLTAKELKKLAALHRKIATGKATRRQVEDAISLRHRDNATAHDPR